MEPSLLNDNEADASSDNITGQPDKDSKIIVVNHRATFSTACPDCNGSYTSQDISKFRLQLDILQDFFCISNLLSLLREYLFSRAPVLEPKSLKDWIYSVCLFLIMNWTLFGM